MEERVLPPFFHYNRWVGWRQRRVFLDFFFPFHRPTGGAIDAPFFPSFTISAVRKVTLPPPFVRWHLSLIGATVAFFFPLSRCRRTSRSLKLSSSSPHRISKVTPRFPIQGSVDLIQLHPSFLFTYYGEGEPQGLLFFFLIQVERSSLRPPPSPSPYRRCGPRVFFFLLFLEGWLPLRRFFFPGMPFSYMSSTLFFFLSPAKEPWEEHFSISFSVKGKFAGYFFLFARFKIRFTLSLRHYKKRLTFSPFFSSFNATSRQSVAFLNSLPFFFLRGQ